MRLNPQLYWKMLDAQGCLGGTDHDIMTGDAYVSHGTAPWIPRCTATSSPPPRPASVTSSRTALLCTPDDIGAGQPQEPSIIHYGLHCTVGSFHFTKYTHGMFDAVGCTGETFGDPPLPGHLERLCAETVLTLNDAMCDCTHAISSTADAASLRLGGRCRPRVEGAKMRSCSDKHEECQRMGLVWRVHQESRIYAGRVPESL